MDKIYTAIDDYAKSYLQLWRIIREENNHFPTCSISSGSIAEFYAKIYLEEKYPNSDVVFGASNEKAWDIKVTTEFEDEILFQVKSTSDYSKSRKVSPLTKGFDQLIVITLACDFFPCQAFLFTDPKVLFKNSSMPNLTVPNPDNKRQRGSEVFKTAINIHEEFFGILADVL